jgi:hypothetical protein
MQIKFHLASNLIQYGCGTRKKLKADPKSCYLSLPDLCKNVHYAWVGGAEEGVAVEGEVGERDVVCLVHSHRLEPGEHLHTRILGHVYTVIITIKNKTQNMENKKNKFGPTNKPT